MGGFPWTHFVWVSNGAFLPGLCLADFPGPASSGFRIEPFCLDFSWTRFEWTLPGSLFFCCLDFVWNDFALDSLCLVGFSCRTRLGVTQFVIPIHPPGRGFGSKISDRNRTKWNQQPAEAGPSLGPGPAVTAAQKFAGSLAQGPWLNQLHSGV